MGIEVELSLTHSRCVRSKVQPITDNFEDYVRTAVDLTRKNVKEYGFAYRVRKRDTDIFRDPITPLFEGTNCHITIERKTLARAGAIDPEDGGFHTHPLTDPAFECEFSSADIAGAKEQGESMLACVSTKADKGAVVYTIDVEDLHNHPLQVPSTHIEKDIMKMLFK